MPRTATPTQSYLQAAGQQLMCTVTCRARLAIQEAYGPSVKVVSVPARPIVMGGGNIHCMTMQQATLQSAKNSNGHA